MRSFIVLIICIELAVIAKLSVSLMMRPVPVSINNDNEFMAHCESGLLVVSFKKDNVLGMTSSSMTSSSWKAIHSEGGLALEGNHGCLLVNRLNGDWNLKYKQCD